MSELHQALKSWIDNLITLPRDILHIYGGFLFYLVWVLIFKGQRKLLGLGILLILAVGNEVLDLVYYFDRSGKMYWNESLSDIFHTVFCPFLLFVFLRFYRVRKG